jgi:hypothetical protein
MRVVPAGFLDVPTWFSWENQGAGLAVADLDGGDQRDLVVLMVDSPPGENQAFYRVARDIDANGEPRGGWGEWTAVPDWFSWENQGAGVAVADVDGDGRAELFVLMVDGAEGPNQGLYRVGKALDRDGAVTGGWGPWIPVPDWLSWQNQHSAITVADVDRDGRPDLVVIAVDNGPQGNRGIYRIGRALDGDGRVTGGWTPWIDVPDWFSWENQGAGVAVADLDRAGLLDIVVFQIDGPAEQNQAFFKIGRNLQPDGSVAGGWSSWLGVPGWFSWENEGGGIAVIDRDDGNDLAVLMVDGPAGENAGHYQLLPMGGDPATQGQWTVLPYHSGVLAVHAALLPMGKVLFFAGSGSSKTRFESADFGNVQKGIYCSVVWDASQIPGPADGSNFSHPNTLVLPNRKVFDFFCAGHSFLADGRLLLGGGTLDYPEHHMGFHGVAECAVFDWQTERWSFAAHTAHGRWYPTLLTLADGRVVSVSGLDEQGVLNGDIEVYDPAADAWEQLHAPGPPEFLGLPLYAHAFLAADGRVLFTGGRMDDPSPQGPCLIDIAQDPVEVVALAGLADPASRNQSASVLLPPAQDQRAMIIGGGPPDQTNATASVDIVDLTDVQPRFEPAAPLNLPRMHLNAVLLPDRTVFVTGGSLVREVGDVARLQSEIYDPATDTWRIMATAIVPRLYHSTAVLLPDGRVVAAGGNPHGGDQVAWEPPHPMEEMRLEIYSPPYLFRGPRPEIDATPTEWRYGERVVIGSPQAGAIRWVSLIRPGITTHSFDSSQRLVDCEIASRGAGDAEVAVTVNPNIAPPGWYMLFLVDREGVPSVARWIHLS